MFLYCMSLALVSLLFLIENAIIKGMFIIFKDGNINARYLARPCYDKLTVATGCTVYLKLHSI